MANKLFLFCIGGTGSRVLRALTFLLASGVDIKATKVIPIIIDPDRENGDLNRTIEILKKYQQVRNKLEFANNGFFKTDVQTLASLKDATSKDGQGLMVPEGFKYEIDGTRQGKFETFLELGQLDRVNKAFLRTLFSERNLAADLSVGFKGNPHMGSVVLNQFKESNEFRYFASRLNEGDRVFIVSSIFGGTGAAGFPLLVKNIRDAKGDMPNHTRLSDVPLGAVTVMPYFGVAPDQSITVDKNTFISKTKAALAYYERHLAGNNSLNALYYIGDKVTADVPAGEGGKEQMNNAHYIELLAALAIIDFMDISDERLECKGGRAVDPVFKEYGLVNTAQSLGELQFLNLGRASKAKIAKPLTQYAYSMYYWKHHLQEVLEGRNKQAFARDGLEAGFLSSAFYRDDLSVFNKRFWEWLEELSRNERRFHPFNLGMSGEQLHNFVRGITQQKKGLLRRVDWDFAEFDSQLNTVDKRLASLPTEQKLMALFYAATGAIFDERIKSQLTL